MLADLKQAPKNYHCVQFIKHKHDLTFRTQPDDENLNRFHEKGYHKGNNSHFII